MNRPTLAPLVLLVLLAAAGSAAAEVRTLLEPRLIDEMDSTRLTLRVMDAPSGTTPDLTPLNRDFDVLGTQSSSQYRSVNGRSSSWLEFQITLRPRRTGELTVPAISVGNQKSEPITLSVRTLDPGTKRAFERMVFFETELSENPVYVQAQTILSRRLYYSNGVQIYSDLPGIPQIPDAVVVPLGDTVSRTETRDGTRYGVIEQRFAIIPEQSGTLTVPEIAVTSSVRLQTGGQTRRSGIRVATAALSLAVLPIPAEYPADQPWLPAQSVSLVDRWTPATGNVQVGDPVSRTLSVAVVGNTGSAIPPLVADVPEDRFKVYPEPRVIDDEASGASLIGARLQTYAIIPTKPGSLDMPPVSITWWDTQQHQVRTSVSEPHRLTITGTELAPATPQAEPQSANAGDAPGAAPSGQAEPEGSNDADAISRAAPVQLSWWWLGTALLAGTLGLVAWGLVRLRGGRRDNSAGTVPQRTQRRAALHRLRQACNRNDPGAMRHSLQELAAVHYGCPASSVAERLRQDPQCADVLDRLNRSLYGAGKVTVSGAEVLAAARALDHPHRSNRSNDLPELFAR